MQIIGTGEDGNFIVLMPASEVRELAGIKWNEPVRIGSVFDVNKAVREFEAVRDLKGDATRAVTDLRALASLLEGELTVLVLPTGMPE